ncbi:TrmH family RNA methyltransferase [Bifidobacterium leontopitheci]|uniref:RNA methyltransferase n=1 Tax=Bifidobacterium leontopitheci TaxID=2650774 RepID=A0A6I1GFA0_9BIFI|nr:TrmH family RNA methyltransferase [Bifidobacterium leontopitheci]KAB7790225.1 RNA methyltransferase [Bifidobacterium leontopitheci]
MHTPNPVSLAAKLSGEPEFREVGVGPWSETHPGEPRPDNPSAPNYDQRFDSTLLDEGDRRNVLDRYRYWTVEAIKADLDVKGRHDFEVAVENWTHDFNIGSMVRTANAFTARRVHIVGPHKWNRKGALMTELYQHVEHHPSIEELVECWRYRIAGEIAAEQACTTADGRRLSELRQARIIALDIIPGAVPIETYRFPKRCLLLFGAEGPGLSQKALDLADDVVYISQFGSVRSINAGAAAAVAMHSWIAQHAAPAGR